MKKLRTLNDFVNRDDHLMDPMNFLMDLKQKLKQQENKPPQQKTQYITNKYTDIQKRRNTATSTSQDLKFQKRETIGSLNKSGLRIERFMSVKNDQDCQDYMSSNDKSQISDNFDENKLLKKQLLTMKQVENQLKETQNKLENKEQIIQDLQNRIIQQQNYIAGLHDKIDQHYVGVMTEDYIEKIGIIQQQNIQEYDDQIMSLMIDAKEFQQKIDEYQDQNQYLVQENEQSHSQLTQLEEQNDQLVEQNNQLGEQCERYLQQIKQLTELYDLIQKTERDEQRFQPQQHGELNRSQVEFIVNLNQRKKSSTISPDIKTKEIFNYFQLHSSSQQDLQQLNKYKKQIAFLLMYIQYLRSIKKQQATKNILQDIQFDVKQLSDQDFDFLNDIQF
ncbi:hypothetical protein pb186bvf_006416 [Paramecium bursaria]